MGKVFNFEAYTIKRNPLENIIYCNPTKLHKMTVGSFISYTRRLESQEI